MKRDIRYVGRADQMTLAQYMTRARERRAGFVLSSIVRRLLQTLLVVLFMSALVFAGLYLVGDPVLMLASPEATDAQRELIRQTLGLDLPLWQPYFIFLGKDIHLDFGNSFLTGESDMRLILERMPSTRSEERCVGKECVSKCRFRWSPENKKK